MTNKTKVTVVQNDAKLVTVEVMAESIKAIADGIKKLRNGNLKDNALFLLIQHAAPYKG